MKQLLCCAAMLSGLSSAGQTVSAQKDTSREQELTEVIVISRQASRNKNSNQLSTLDQYLSSHEQVDLIKRGAYAWEPMLNGLSSERSVITIDGMRIYGACTDKMDPVSSYVETTNLSRAVVKNGQSGNAHGGSIAGSLDLVRKKSGFGNNRFATQLFTGFESNNQQRIVGTDLQYSRNRWYADLDFTYRKAGNYSDGKKQEILYSQFSKFNLSAAAGYKLNEHQQLEASVIVDDARDIGYPALPMDVSSAKAVITSLAYTRHHLTSIWQEWETKIYHNKVTHVMDDTKRPVVPIRMDMPGWSTTTGMYSRIEGKVSGHQFKLTASAHHNRSLAEMTMYPNDPTEKEMFMLTWPDVHTLYAGLFAEDNFQLHRKWTLNSSGGIAFQQNQLKDEAGVKTLQIFYPEMQSVKNRLLKNFGSSLQYQPGSWRFSMGASYSERAPGVSEGYGFYLFNSFDRFDYIGNPGLKNEQSISLNGTIAFANDRFSVKGQGNWFHIRKYIIGMPANGLIPMTIGASGIKIYEQVPFATIYSASLNASYGIVAGLSVSGKAIYRRGFTNEKLDLPMMQPLSYGLRLQYTSNAFSAEASMDGAIKQSKYSPLFGETAAPAYTIAGTGAGYQFKWKKNTFQLRAGVDNLFNRYYTTFADWNRIPRMGRNLFLNLIIGFSEPLKARL
jgi:iron complex outermembrane receptor protein